MSSLPRTPKAWFFLCWIAIMTITVTLLVNLNAESSTDIAAHRDFATTLTPTVHENPADAVPPDQLPSAILMTVQTDDDSRSLPLLTADPQPPIASGRNAIGACLPDEDVPVLDTTQVDGQPYFQVWCGGKIGWLAATTLAPYTPPSYEDFNLYSRVGGADGSTVGQSFELISDDNLFELNFETDPTQTCSDGEVVRVRSEQPVNVSPEFQQAALNSDLDVNEASVFLYITCQDGEGFILDRDVQRGLMFPAPNGRGIIALDIGYAPLAQAGGPLSDVNPMVATCPAGTVFTTINATVSDDIIYYEIECADGGGIGWTPQRSLLDVRFLPQTTVMIEGLPYAGGQTLPDLLEHASKVPDAINEWVLPVFLTPIPAIATPNNTNGLCFPNTVVIVEAIALVETHWFYQVTCAGQTGWIEAGFLTTYRETDQTDADAIPPPWQPDYGDSVAVTVPTRYAVGATTIAPYSGSLPFFFLTRLPEPLAAGVANADASCSFGSAIEILEVRQATHNDTTDIYYWVRCTGNYGWVADSRLPAPFTIQPDQYAVALPIGIRGESIAETGRFDVLPQAIQPPRPDMPLFPDAGQNCQVGEVVHILQIGVFDNDLAFHLYLIECAEGIGWVAGDRLQGPMALSVPDGAGIIRPDSESVDLTTNAGPSSDTNAVVGSCPRRTDTITFVTTRDMMLIDGEAYYQIECSTNSIIGWAAQLHFIAAPPILNTNRLTIGTPTDDVQADISIEQLAAATFTLDGFYLAVPIFGDLDISADPVGYCATATIISVTDLEVVDAILLYNVDCGDLNGWIESRFAPNPVEVLPNMSIWFVNPSTTALPEDEGFALLNRPHLVDRQAGQCELRQEATILDVTLYQHDLRQLGYIVFYYVSCQSIEGQPINGWAASRDLIPAIVLTPPN